MDVNSYSQSTMVVLTAAINDLLISQHTGNVMTPQWASLSFASDYTCKLHQFSLQTRA